MIPIILRYTYWQEVKELAQLQALPEDAIPIMSSSWDQKDEAFLDVVKGIHKVANEINIKLSKTSATLTIKKPMEGRSVSAPSSILHRDIHPDRQATIHRLLCQLVDERPELALDNHNKRIVRFGVKSWDIPVLTAEDQPPSGRILIFTIEDKKQSLDFQLGMGSSPKSIDIREKLFHMADNHRPPFGPRNRNLPTIWSYLYQREILHPQQYNRLSDEELEAAIRKEWSIFMENTLPQLDAVLKEQEWFR